MFSRLKKTEPKVYVLSVANSEDRSRVGLLEVGRDHSGYHGSKARLRVLSVSRSGGTEIVRFFILDERGREAGAATAEVQNGSFKEDQILRVDAVNIKSPVG